MSRLLIIWFAALLPASPMQAAEKPIAHSLFTAHGPLFGNSLDQRDRIWFSSFDEQARYAVDRPSAADVESLADVLRISADPRLSLTIIFDAASGRVDDESGTLVYPICSVALDERKFTSRHACANRAIDEAKASGVELLAIGHALAQEYAPTDATRLLTMALDKGKLSPAARRITLSSRGDAHEVRAYHGEWESVDADRSLIAALADYRALAALEPSDPAPSRSVGRVLGELGDYGAAMNAYRDVIKRWPGEDETVSVSMAAVARNSGDLKQSIEILNGIAERHGTDQGMRYYYHRGWTLTALGRFDEAVAAFSEGMKTQPDYAWAFMKRGCAYASTGQHARALDDVDQAIAITSRIDSELDTAASRADERRRTEIRALLKDAVNAKNTVALSSACGGFAGPGENPRSRSQLLD